MNGPFEQVAAAYGAGGLEAFVFGASTVHGYGDVFRCPLGVGDQLPREVNADIRQHPGHSARIRASPRRAVSQSNHGVVGGHAAIGIDAIEADHGCLAECLIELVGWDLRVSCDEHQHRRETGSEHSGTLGHAADHISLALPNCELGNGVGRHDRQGR